MSKDHFIAQTYLKHFGDPATGGMLHAYRKSDGAKFPCWPKDVCHEPDGDENPLFLNRPEALGEFRNIFEPYWNLSIEKILTGNMTAADKFNVSAYMANLMACTPTWKRIGVKMYSDAAVQWLSFGKKMKEKHGGASDFPNELVKAVEMLERRKLRFKTEPEYIKAIATTQLLDYTWATYNQDWLIITNRTDQPFITSDNPSAIDESTGPWTVKSRYLPVTPELCVSVRYDPKKIPKLNHEKAGEYARRPPQGTVKRTEFNLAGVKMINRLVAQCAEELVFSPKELDGVETLVRKYANHWVDAAMKEIPMTDRDGGYLVFTISICERNHLEQM